MRDDFIRYGTSSFSEKDWVGVFYPRGTKPGEYLKYYATRFDTVEVDATYYAVPAKSTVQKWYNDTPDNFLLSAKFPRLIVHCGEKATPDAGKILLPDYTYNERDWFLSSIIEMKERLGMLVLQFPYFSKKVFESPDIFYARLDRFLEDLPSGFDYGVEIRNKWWIKQRFVDILKKHNVSLVLVGQAWMPHGDEVESKYDLSMGGYIYIRLLGDRKGIEEITTSWDRVVVDHSESLHRWAVLAKKLRDSGRKLLIYANNHYAGHGPETARTLQRMVNELDGIG